MESRDSSYVKGIVATITQPLVVLKGDLQIESVNEAFCSTFHVSAAETQRRKLYDLGNGQWDILQLRRLLEEILPEHSVVEDFRIDHEFEAIGRKVMLLNARRLQLPGGEDRILIAIDDFTEAENYRFEIEGRIEFADKLIGSIRELLMVLDWDLRVKMANKSFYDHFGVSREVTEGRLIYQLGNGQWDIPELRDLLERILPEEFTFDDFEMAHDFEGIGQRVMRLNARRLDRLNLIILAIRDVTDARRHQESQTHLMGELQHRVKNILNNVMALAQHLRRRSSDLDEFAAALMPRLEALALSQELITRTPDQNVELADIIRSELDAVGATHGQKYTLRGPPVQLPPRVAQAMGSAIRELTTNACKYGALRSEDGRADIAWRLEESDRPKLHFHWREHGIRIGQGMHSPGFGTEVIEQSIPYMLGGTSKPLFHTDGVECSIVFPLKEPET